jgi:hypothetical protein
VSLQWIKIETRSPRDPAVMRLRRLLGDSPNGAFGLWVRAALWTAETEPDGDLTEYAPIDLAEAWETTEEGVRHMETAGLLVREDGRLLIAGWAEMTAGWGEAERKRRWRAAQALKNSPAGRTRDGRGTDARRTRPSERRGEEKNREDAEEISSPSLHVSKETPSVPAPSAPTQPEAPPLVLAVAEPSPSRSARRRPTRAHPEGEVDPSDAETPVVVELLSTDGPMRLRESLCRQLAEANPAIDVPTEARRAAVWLVTNPTKRKTRRGMGAFIARWMAEAQDRGRGVGRMPIAQPDPRGALVARPRPGEVMADLGRRLEEAQARGLGDGGYAALGALSAERRAEARARAVGGGS